MKKLLIFATLNDKSVPFFLTNNIKEKINIDFCLYQENEKIIVKKLKNNNYDYIYLRDPFINQGKNVKEVKNKINLIIKNKKNAYLIDKIENIDDIMFEDKWLQYKFFSDVMPKTEIYNGENSFGSKSIYKRRISSRSEGVFFDSKQIKNNYNKYIVQKIIDIKNEYRVYTFFGEVLEKAILRNSKTKYNKLSPKKVTKISKKTKEFAKSITDRSKFDLIGLDIVETKKGEFYLIELNRACLFNAYWLKSEINIAELFIDKLLKI